MSRKALPQVRTFLWGYAPFCNFCILPGIIARIFPLFCDSCFYVFFMTKYSYGILGKKGLKIMKKKSELPVCPVATTVQLIGSKWKLLIMRNLLVRPWRFNELLKDLEGISQKVLTDSLRSMEADGIIVRTVYPEVPPHVEYSLSELGETMRPIMDAMEIWGNNYKKNYVDR